MLQRLQCSLAAISGTRNEWASLTQLRSCGTRPQRKSWEGAPQQSALWGAVYEIRSQIWYPARVSATLLHKDSSLYDAMRAIIGAELRSKLDVPQVMPSYLDDLLKELDDRLGSDQVDGSAHRQAAHKLLRGTNMSVKKVLILVRPALCDLATSPAAAVYAPAQ